jgi:hypothetical protein
MIDMHAGSPAAPPPLLQDFEFLRIELSPLEGGTVFVSMTATTVDEEEPQLLEQELASEQAESIDELLAIIRRHVRFCAN